MSNQAASNRPAHKVTIYDVARDAGVSFGTVSRVLNGRKDVSEKTRQAVLASIQRLNYVRNPLATGLARQSTGLIGFVSAEVEPSADRVIFYVQELQQGVLSAVRAHDHHVVLLDPLDCSGDRLNETARLVDGLVIRGRLPTGDIEQVQAVLPVVAINDRSVTPHVAIDHYVGAKEALEHLVELGHRRIALMPGTGRPSSAATQARVRAYHDALRVAGLPDDPQLVTESVGINNPYLLFQHLDALLALPDPPTAFVIGGDVLAIEAIGHFHRRGIRVPSDVSVIGSSDLPLARIVDPPLTTVHAPLREVGAKAAEMVAQVILQERAAEIAPSARQRSAAVSSAVYPTHLRLRGTTAPPPAK